MFAGPSQNAIESTTRLLMQISEVVNGYGTKPTTGGDLSKFGTETPSFATQGITFTFLIDARAGQTTANPTGKMVGFAHAAGGNASTYMPIYNVADAELQPFKNLLSGTGIQIELHWIATPGPAPRAGGNK